MINTLPPLAPRLSLAVSAVRGVAEGCKLFELVDAKGRALPPAEPGAHIGLILANGMERQYSLIEPDPEPSSYAIAVKRDPHSRGGSTFIFDHLKVGDTLVAEAPRNNFPLEESASHTVLIAGGIGITPIRSMARRLQQIGRSWTLHFAVRTRSEAAFLDELASLPNAHFHFDDEAGGILPMQDIVLAAPSASHLYCCGPAPMLKAFEEACASVGLPETQVHVEYFTQRYEASTEGGFLVSLARSGQEVHVAPGQTILDALRGLGIEVASSCEEGICGACETRVLEGIPDHRDAILTERERQANKSMFICCSGARSERLVLDI
jgi:ferredoxin-NADP reductase